MMMRKTVILLVLLLAGKYQLVQAQEPGSPMACAFTGKIVCVCKDKADNDKSPCAKYPCKARVAILEVKGCGSSVTQPLAVGDTVMMNFAYTLHKTKKIFPKMKATYPGLKRRKTFSASAEQKNLPGNAVKYIIYDYTLK